MWKKGTNRALEKITPHINAVDKKRVWYPELPELELQMRPLSSHKTLFSQTAKCRILLSFYYRGNGRPAIEIVILSHSISPFIQYSFLMLRIWYFWELVILNYDL